MTEYIIKRLTPDLLEDYFDFFDNRAFSDGSPFYPCYCNAFNMSQKRIQDELYKQAAEYGSGEEGWKRALRESAMRMVKLGEIQGYLVYDKGTAVGWCNANDRLNYYRDEYETWVNGVTKECTVLELEILKDFVSKTKKKIFVDTNIPVEILHKISDENHVLIMLADPNISVQRFFERPDKEKQFLYQLLLKEDNPEEAMINVRECLKRINS